MKKWWSLLGGVALALGVAGCGGGKPALHVYIWSDYLDPAIIPLFEKQANCKLVLDYYDSNETMYAKLKAGGGGYDIVVPSSYMVNIMREQGMLLPLNHDLLPNLQHLDPTMRRFTMDPEHVVSVPYMLGCSGIGYLRSKVPNLVPSWSVFSRQDLAGRMTLLNDMREAMGAALKFLGHSLNTTNEVELAAARDQVIQWKRQIAKFESEQYKNGLVSAEFLACQGYSGDVMQTMEENKDIAFVVPQEGTSVAIDDLVILKDARQTALAHAFINFLHDPEIAAKNMEFVFYLCPNQSAYSKVSAELRTNDAVFLKPEVLVKSETIFDVGAANARYAKMWDEIKAAK